MRACAETLESEMSAEELRLLQRLLAQNSKQGKHLEIGTAAGGTLVSMMKTFADDQRPPFVVVDRMTYFPNQQQLVYENLRANQIDPSGVDFRQASSSQAYRQARSSGETFEFILVDASHKIISVMADLRWAGLLKPGGIICFHDYSPKFPGVRMCVDRFLGKHQNYQRLDCAGTLLAIRKTAAGTTDEVTISDRIYSIAWHFPLEIERRRAKRQIGRVA
ncbi:MAG: class I SAM-dependent methyltransferase [Planctomycetota bacterium]|nr:MAG: class I SAM-dependent methyltransferase [Planctomycetota bacterium]